MFKIYTKTHDDGEWNVVIDVKKSKTSIVERIFTNQDEVNGFIRVALKDKPEEHIKVESFDGEE